MGGHSTAASGPQVCLRALHTVGPKAKQTQAPEPSDKEGLANANSCVSPMHRPEGRTGPAREARGLGGRCREWLPSSIATTWRRVSRAESHPDTCASHFENKIMSKEHVCVCRSMSELYGRNQSGPFTGATCGCNHSSTAVLAAMPGLASSCAPAPWPPNDPAKAGRLRTSKAVCQADQGGKTQTPPACLNRVRH